MGEAATVAAGSCPPLLVDAPRFRFPATPEGCAVSKFYEVLKFSCKHTEPDKTDKYHMELDDDSADSTTKVKIKQDGWYSISFTALLTTNDKQNRAEIFKISSRNPDSSCASVTASCEALLQLRGKDTVD